MEDEIRSEGTTPMPDALQALLANPALLKGLAGALGAMQAPSATPRPEAPDSETTSATVPMGDGLAALLSNPAVLEKLPQIMATMKPLMESAQPSAAAVPVAARPAPEVCREQLLQALKPFLSHERCEAIDTILRLSKLGAVFGQIK